MAREFGDIPGVAVGTTFETREAVAAAGLHKPLQAGISGGAKEGADSIVLSGAEADFWITSFLSPGFRGKLQSASVLHGHEESVSDHWPLVVTVEVP